MRYRTRTTLLIATLLFLAPFAARANGWGAVEVCFKTTLWTTAIGCVAGLIIALCRHVRVGGLFAWTIGGGIALGLAGLLVFVMVSSPNNPDFLGFALLSLGAAVVVAGFGGGLLAAIAAGIRSRRPRRNDGDQPPHPPQPL